MTDSYVKHGFLADLYGEWVRFEGTEWGDCLRPLLEAYEMGNGGLWVDDDLEHMEAVLSVHLETAAEEGYFEEYYPGESLLARQAFDGIVERWAKVAQGFGNSSENFQALVDSIPAWMRPPDPEEIKQSKLNKLREQAQDLAEKHRKVLDQIEKLS